MPALQNKPPMDDYLVYYWNAFLFLSGSRVFGSAIPITEMIAYADLKGLSTSGRDFFVRAIRRMDLKFLSMQR